jgi:hypothetical protein
MAEMQADRNKRNATTANESVRLRVMMLIIVMLIVDVKFANTDVVTLVLAIIALGLYVYARYPDDSIYYLSAIGLLITSACGYSAMSAVMVGVVNDITLTVVEMLFTHAMKRVDSEGQEDAADVAATAVKASKE